MKRLNFLIFSFIICIESVISTSEFKSDLQQIYVHELFTFRVSPAFFNFTSSSMEQFRYRPSLLGRPSLPSWMNFQFSKERQFGYLYGSASEKYANQKIDVEIVCLNKQNYETRRIVIPIEIIAKTAPLNRIEMNITNLNWVHMTDLGRVKNLKGIFTEELWPESEKDLSIIFMESAVKFGARLPLKPNNREGVIVHLGSNQKISKRLIELSKEIKPLAKLTTCTFKKTKEQQTFQNAGFAIDWCAFKIILHQNESETSSSSTENPSFESEKLTKYLWHGMSRDEVPERNYSEELAIAIAIPSVLLAIFVAMLTVIICFNHEKLQDEESIKFLDSLFDMCKRNVKTLSEESSGNQEPLQLVQYSGSDNNSPKTAALRSIREPYLDNLSIDSQSPSGSPQINPYYRPTPPAYGKVRFDGPSSSSTVRFADDI